MLDPFNGPELNSDRPDIGEERLKIYNRPLIAMDSHRRIQVNLATAFVGGSAAYPLSPSAPSLTPAQVHALATFQRAAQRVALRLTPKAGDVLFVNNYAVLHARDTWTDSATDPLQRRYLMRLWLHDEGKGWASAAGLKRDLGVDFDLGPEEQALMTGREWDGVPRGWRVKRMGVASVDNHD